ncbi:MAG: hypothetical protein ACHQ53_12130 [Polyangiales bacterium]
METPSTTADGGFGPIDRAYATLRLGALLVGAGYPYLARAGSGMRDSVLIAFAVFAVYGAVFYTAGLGWLRDASHKRRFYAALGAADLAFVIVLMNMTGGQASPFYRALYLWVAMPAFYFGFRTGTVASAVAFLAFTALFDVSDHNPWEVLVRAGGLLLHGPGIGYLVDRDREHRAQVRALQARVDQLEHAH